MHLVQLFLPLRDNAGASLPPALFAAVRAELTDAFGGITAYGVSRDGRGAAGALVAGFKRLDSDYPHRAALTP